MMLSRRRILYFTAAAALPALALVLRRAAVDLGCARGGEGRKGHAPAREVQLNVAHVTRETRNGSESRH